MANELTEVNLPNSVKTMLTSAFEENPIKKVILSNQLEELSNSVFQGNDIEKLDIPDNIKLIGEYAFMDNLISELSISKNVTKISAAAFWNNALTEVEIPASVTFIDMRAFQANSLSEVVFNEGLNTVQLSAFAENELSNLNLPNSISTIGNNIMDNQYIDGYYKKVGNEWEFDFDDLSSGLFNGNTMPFIDLMLDGEPVTIDPDTHVLKMSTDPNGKDITYNYIPHHPTDPNITGTEDSVTITLEPLPENIQ